MTDRPFTILSTGAAEQHNGLTPTSIPEAIRVENIPFIRILLSTDNHTRDAVGKFTDHHHVVVFTSANAVRAVTALIEKKPAWTIYCVGRVTSTQATLFFGEDSIAGTAPDAAALADLIIRDQVPNVIFFSGDQRREVLPQKLKENGTGLQELIVYQTRQTPVKLETNFDAILFFSPTAVSSFFSINTILPATVLFALGSTTADTLAKYSGNEILLSSSPDKKTLLKMALNYGQSHPIS